MSIWRWAEWLEPVSESARISLGEGNTPIVRSRRLGPELGLRNLYFKLDFAMPTGSYKDRYSAMAISLMRASGQTRCVATSSGNTGASLAAYCAAAGIECHIAIVERAPEGKLQQMLAYGAKLYRIHGFGIDPAVTATTMKTIERLGSCPGSAVQISAYHYCPGGMSGVKTLSYELAEQLPNIDHLFLQAGGGGLTAAVGRGFEDLLKFGRIAKLPRLEIVQPAGNDTIVAPLQAGSPDGREVTCTTRISGLQVPSVIDARFAIDAVRNSQGSGHLVEDEDVWAVQQRLAREEGIFCEPAAATSVTGALNAARAGKLKPESVVVCTVTGIGFKDPPSVQRMIADATCPLISTEEFANLQ